MASFLSLLFVRLTCSFFLAKSIFVFYYSRVLCPSPPFCITPPSRFLTVLLQQLPHTLFRWLTMSGQSEDEQVLAGAAGAACGILVHISSQIFPNCIPCLSHKVSPPLLLRHRRAARLQTGLPLSANKITCAGVVATALSRNVMAG